MKINKQKFLIKLFLLSFLLVESTGFDFYAHSIIYYYNNIQITHSYSLLDNFIIIPRYGFLSSIYEFASSIGLPLGIIVLIIIYLPINSIINHFDFSSRTKVKFDKIILVGFLAVMIFFYSGLSISILYILSYLITKKKFYLIGAFFHPVTIFLFPILAIFIFNFRTITYLFILYLIFFSYAFLSTKYLLQNSFNNEIIKFNIDNENFIDLLKFTYELKPNEINLMIIITIVFLYIANSSKYFFMNLFNVANKKLISIKQINLFLFVSLILLQSYFNIRDRATFFNSILSNNKVINVTWFDFGEKNFNASFETLNELR